MRRMVIGWVLGAVLVGASQGFAADTATTDQPQAATAATKPAGTTRTKGKAAAKSPRARATTKSPRSTKTTHAHRSTKPVPATQTGHAAEPVGTSTPK